MKIAVTGKGGVGKTTLSSSLARHYAMQGRKVVAVDADPDANLASALGMDIDAAAKLVPIADMEQLVLDRTGAKPGSIGGFFKLNPRVDDLPEELSIEVDGVRLMVMGGVDHGGHGCVCPESALLKALLRHLVMDRDDVVIMDMEAGVEHLGRSTAESVDAFIVVVEPGQRSVQTARTVAKLAQDIGVKRVYVVVNKVRSQEEEDMVSELLPDLPVLGSIPELLSVRRADLDGACPYDVDPELAAVVDALAVRLEGLIAGD